MKPCYVLFTLLMILQNVAGRPKRIIGGCPAKPGEAPWLVFIRNCDTEEKYDIYRGALNFECSTPRPVRDIFFLYYNLFIHDCTQFDT